MQKIRCPHCQAAIEGDDETLVQELRRHAETECPKRKDAPPFQPRQLSVN